MSKLAFFSTCPEIWGGSEELWASAARRLAAEGHRVDAYKTLVKPRHPKIAALLRAGCEITDLQQIYFPLWLRITQRFLPQRWQALLGRSPLDRLLGRRWVKPPVLAVISQGENFDGVHLAERCRVRGIPYVLICQKASDVFWPPADLRMLGQRVYTGARRCYFVSEHNLQLTQAQLGLTLARAAVVRNPVLAGRSGPLPWPDSSCWRLACVARLWIQDKGQDMLLRALSQSQWRERKLEVTLVGAGVHGEALEGLAARLQLVNVRFGGSVENIEDVWRTHHGLVLSSRAEGLPLAAVEAMMCGRPCFLTPVGGNAELVSRSEVGLVAEQATVEGLSDLLERAWAVRERWAEMGLAAASHVREFVPVDPEEAFCALLRKELSAWN